MMEVKEVTTKLDTLVSSRLFTVWRKGGEHGLGIDSCLLPPAWRAGILFRLGSCWVGGHWSSYNRRLCVNVVPCITLWVTKPGGIVP